jgi:hypothetical protein
MPFVSPELGLGTIYEHKYIPLTVAGQQSLIINQKSEFGQADIGYFLKPTCAFYYGQRHFITILTTLHDALG